MIWLAVVIVAAAMAGVWMERRVGASAELLSRRLMTFLLWGVLPPVAFFNIAVLDFTPRVGAGIAFAYVAVATTLALAFVLGTYVLRLERPSVGALMLVAGFANTGFLGLPLVAALLGFDELPNAVAYDLLVSAMTLATVGFSIGAAFGTVADRVRDRALAFFARNPPLYATIAGLLAPTALAPNWAVDGSRLLVLAVVPIGFFSVGVTLAHEAGPRGARLPAALRPAVAGAVALKLLVAPAIVLGLGWAFVPVPGAYVVQAAMASGVNTIVIASTYGLDRALVAAVIAWTTAIVLAAGLAASLL